MGRDSTASKRMAAKRSREKAAGLRRLNVAVVPEILEKLTVLMKQHSCTSQAQLIELLVMHNATISSSQAGKARCNEVTLRRTKCKHSAASETNSAVRQKKASGNTMPVTPQHEPVSAQMSLF